VPRGRPARYCEHFPFRPIPQSVSISHSHIISIPPYKSEHNYDIERQEKSPDSPGLTLDEVLQLIRNLWEVGLTDSVPFLVLISQLRSLVAASAEGDSNKNELEDVDCDRTLVNRDPEDARPFRACCEPCSEGNSSVDPSEYTVRSIMSFKERTNWLPTTWLGEAT
jgi:hypothetical protein